MKRIFIGFENTAGICTRLKKGFEQLGIKTDFYSFSEHKFGYQTDKIIRYPQNRIARTFLKFFLLTKFLIKYDYFIYVSFDSLFRRHFEIKLYRLFGKKTMVIFTGCDIRMPEKVEKYRWNPCRNCTEEYKKFTGCVIQIKERLIPETTDKFDFITCPVEASGYLNKEYADIFFPIDLTEFELSRSDFPASSGDNTLRILHAPTHETYKGSDYIRNVMKKISQRYKFEYREVRNLPVKKLYKEIIQSDIIIDQMLVGFYGLISVEAMAMGKAVVCYVRDDIWENIKNDCPVINANPDNLQDVLENLLSNRKLVRDAALRGEDYVKKFHDAKNTAKQIFDKLNSKYS